MWAIPGMQEVRRLQGQPGLRRWLPAGRTGAPAFAPELTLWVTAQVPGELPGAGLAWDAGPPQPQLGKTLQAPFCSQTLGAAQQLGLASINMQISAAMAILL